MYEVKSDTVIDIASEIQAMVEHVTKRWNHLPADLAGYFGEIQKQAAQAAAAWFDDFAVLVHAEGRLESREALLKRIVSTDIERLWAPTYDQSCVFLLQLSRAARTVLRNATEEFYFENEARKVYVSLTARFPEIVDARPVGFNKKGGGHGGMERYAETLQQKEKEAFQGANIGKGSAVCFATRTSAPHVAYDHYEQNREAPFVLTYAVFGHFLEVQKHENTRAMLEALAVLNLRDTEETLVFDLELGNRPSTNRLVNAVVRECSINRKALENYLDAIADKRC